MSKVKIGIVGAKFAAELHATAYGRCADAEVVAVCDLDAARVGAFADKFGLPKRYTDYHQLMQDPEIQLISICVPNFLHAEVALAACAAGKDVVCEKPIATTVEQAKQMVAAFREKGLRLMYAEDWNFAPALIRAKQIVDEGAIGKILYLKAKETHNGSHSPFAQKLTFCGGGALLHLGCHPAAFTRYLTGQEVVSVTSVCTPGLDGNLVQHGLEGEDLGVAMLTLENGTYALIEGNYITQGGMDDSVEIYGTLGVLKVNLTFGSPLSVYSPVGYSYVVEKADLSTGWTNPAIDEFYSLGYQNELAEFVKCVKENRPVPAGATGEDGLAALGIVKAAYLSSQEGRPVDPRTLWKE